MSRIVELVVKFLATGGLVGYLPVARGTFGTLIGVAIFILLSGYTVVFYALIVILTVIAFPVSNYAEKEIFKTKDSSYIVIDEVVGYLVSTVGFTFSFNPQGITILVLTFIIFRIFDIFKPYPIVHIQSLGGGVGIVLDDIFAGVMTNILVRILMSFEISRIFMPLF
ncbi:MAG: phosphatidylglycerophosphatase A [Spirochaetia bacterium]|nr:phosphatidylglycerophosphatase A [Spirochaetota bacterium]MCX8095918.1 phosphatidylglycerophosphatase A [Spirochaetota bacterium]MDW8112246.1 phosphatidylglycerophosphatase A [Spirochaetia bacterium]